jgi:hypothetical protein
MILSSDSPLPYKDTKPVGAADFYFAINATFRFLIDRLGMEGWQTWLRDMAREYYRPVWESWRRGGLEAVSQYLDAAFQAEPGAVFEIRKTDGDVVLHVQECPAIKHLRAHGREIVPAYCRHCQCQFGTMADLAGLHARVQGGNGSCTQTFSERPQERLPNDILEAA